MSAENGKRDPSADKFLAKIGSDPHRGIVLIQVSTTQLSGLPWENTAQLAHQILEHARRAAGEPPEEEQPKLILP